MRIQQTGLAALAMVCGVLLTGQMAFAADPAPVPAKAAVKREPSKTIPKGFLLKTLNHDAQDYRYVLYVPADYDESKNWPTIIFLNGAGECGRDGMKQAAVGLGGAVMLDSEHWPFLILFPQKPEIRQTWLENDALVMAMLDATKSDYKVDTTRIYLTGLSQGGFGTWAIGAKHPDLFAAIAPICGGIPDKDQFTPTTTALKTMPIWAFHGEADPVVPMHLSADAVKAVKDAGGDATLTTYPGVGHNSWDKAYREEKLYDWFLKHKREAK